MMQEGSPQTQFLNVFQAIILSRIQYASSVWYGNTSKTHIESIQRMLVNAKRWRILNKLFTVVDLFDDSDRSILSQYVLHGAPVVYITCLHIQQNIP